MVSSKLLRLPTRGALGNGLRVVAGAVLASGGSLIVTTRNRRIGLRPERDATTTVIGAETVKFPVGTRVEVRLERGRPLGHLGEAEQVLRGPSQRLGLLTPLGEEDAGVLDVIRAARLKSREGDHEGRLTDVVIPGPSVSGRRRRQAA
jgi:hypothetical protein